MERGWSLTQMNGVSFEKSLGPLNSLLPLSAPPSSPGLGIIFAKEAADVVDKRYATAGKKRLYQSFLHLLLSLPCDGFVSFFFLFFLVFETTHEQSTFFFHRVATSAKRVRLFRIEFETSSMAK